MIKLADKKKREREEYNLQLENEAFYKWLEEYGEEKLMKQLPVDMMVLFSVRAKEAMEWIKINIYRKELHRNK